MVDLTGKRYGKLKIIEKAQNQGRWTCWKCICDCGNMTIKKTRDLQKGDTKSCGCYFQETLRTRITKHHKKGTRLYRIWSDMKSRCYNSKTSYFKYYGGRGIVVCDEWLCDFQAFYLWSMAHGYKDNLSIDRIDVNGNYEPNNCRWATMKEQANNKQIKKIKN